MTRKNGHKIFPKNRDTLLKRTLTAGYEPEQWAIICRRHTKIKQTITEEKGKT